MNFMKLMDELLLEPSHMRDVYKARQVAKYVQDIDWEKYRLTYMHQKFFMRLYGFFIGV